MGIAVALVLAIAGSLATLSAQPVAATGPTVEVSGSPFDLHGDGVRETVRITLTTTDSATIELRIVDFDGRRVRTLSAATRSPGQRRPGCRLYSGIGHPGADSARS